MLKFLLLVGLCQVSVGNNPEASYYAYTKANSNAEVDINPDLKVLIFLDNVESLFKHSNLRLEVIPEKNFMNKHLNTDSPFDKKDYELFVELRTLLEYQIAGVNKVFSALAESVIRINKKMTIISEHIEGWRQNLYVELKDKKNDLSLRLKKFNIALGKKYFDYLANNQTIKFESTESKSTIDYNAEKKLEEEVILPENGKIEFDLAVKYFIYIIKKDLTGNDSLSTRNECFLEDEKHVDLILNVPDFDSTLPFLMPYILNTRDSAKLTSFFERIKFQDNEMHNNFKENFKEMIKDNVANLTLNRVISTCFQKLEKKHSDNLVIKRAQELLSLVYR